MKLIDERTLDGSRQFASLPQTVAWDAVCSHLLQLPGVEIVNSHSDLLGRAWLNFQFSRHHFFLKAADGALVLFVRDPRCADLVLFQVGSHLEQLVTDEPPPMNESNCSLHEKPKQQDHTYQG